MVPLYRVKSELDAWVASRGLTTPPKFPVASVATVSVLLKVRITEMNEVVARLKKLMLEIHASREILRDTIRRMSNDLKSGARPGRDHS
jgi:hypothetical protein